MFSNEREAGEKRWAGRRAEKEKDGWDGEDDQETRERRGGVSKKCKGFNGGRAENGLVC